MRVDRRQFVKLAAATALVTGVRPAWARRRRRHFGSRQQAVRCDVCVLGGGSAGTYAALRLRDLGQSVFLVERKERLGGHAETYIEPTTQTPIDMGVVVFENVELVQDYFSRLGVEAVPLAGQGPPPEYVDMATGRRLDFLPPEPAAFGAALGAYRELLATRYSYLDDGFELPDPVPEELVQPFEQFVENNGLQALFPTLFQFGQGLGDVLRAPALYVLKNFSAAVVDAILQQGFLTLPAGAASVYDAAAEQLGSDVISFNSEVEYVERRCRGPFPVRVLLRTPEGSREVFCRKLVVAFPPNHRGLRPLGLGQTERRLLSRFRPNHYSSAVVRVEGLATSLQNVGDGTPYDLPQLPGLYGVTATAVPGVFNVKFGSPRRLRRRVVQWQIRAAFEALRSQGGFDIEFGEFLAFSDHSPFELMVTPRHIGRGFYEQLGQLQGHQDTFYTGAAFQTNDSSLIWRFTEGLLPSIVA